MEKKATEKKKATVIRNKNKTVTKITHWLPIITFCPLSIFPDFIFVTLLFENEFVELYGARKRIRKAIQFKRDFMENLLENLKKEFPNAKEISIRLAFNKHETKFIKG